MITKNDTLLSKSLIEKKLISADTLKSFVEEASKSKDSLFSLLLKRKAVPEDQILSNLSTVLKIRLINAEALKTDPEVVSKVPLKVAEYYKLLPMKLNKKKLTVAVSEPLDLRTQDEIRAQLGLQIEMVLAREQDISEALKKTYGFAAGTIGEIVSQAPESSAAVEEPEVEKVEDIEQMAGDASIAKLVNQIILEAYQKRASDIHIEPYRGKVKLRYRIDGVLYNSNVQPEISRLILPILSRVKIMSNLNIVEKRLPQDGRAIVKVEDTQLDLRVSSIPTPYGESVVIRMLPMNKIYDLNQLGLNPHQLKIVDELIHKPHGIIFITGPTGSGKSTTLYAALKRINTDERKIITIEDPVEYEMEGITQIQVMSSIGLDFARGLRSILRHDPDVIMVGEVRDLETAEIAIRVALTGHLVFSTLHTNTAAGGVTRLIDIGLQPYLVASSVEAFIAQRLIRVICSKCKEEDKSVSSQGIKKRIIRELGLKPGEKIVLYRGKGCHECNSTGFRGRVAIYEMLLVDEPIKQLIMRRAPVSEIYRTAMAQGMKTLIQDGWLKVSKGITTKEEVLALEDEGRQDGLGDAEEGLSGSGKIETIDRKAAPGLSKAPSRYSDQRAFDRTDVNVNVRYRLVKLPGESSEASELKRPEEFTVTRNLSAGGLVFLAKDGLVLGSKLEMVIELPDEVEPVDCLARVVRVEEVEQEKRYEVAVCFLDLSRTDRLQIEKFVQKQIKSVD